MGPECEFAAARPQARRAGGDATLWKSNVAQEADGTIMGAWGDYEKGWSELAYSIAPERSIPPAAGNLSASREFAGMDPQLYRRHAWPVRLTHWISALALLLLLTSGLQIFNAHPSLYWGESSYTGAGPVLELQQGFPSWLTLPSNQWLAMGRRWHFFFAWVLVINVAAYLTYAFASGHLRRDLVVRGADWRSIGRSLREHLRLHRPRGAEATRYNVLQKLSYLFVIFVLLPFMVLTGMAMSPWLDSLLPGWVGLFGGRQSARTLHFAGAWLLVLFAAIHVFEVIVTGFWNNLRSMITGRYRVPPAADQP